MKKKTNIKKEKEKPITDEHVITRSEAIALGMGKLTTPYKANERKMMQAVIEDMKRGNITYGLVKTGTGIEVWRTGMRKIDDVD